MPQVDDLAGAAFLFLYGIGRFRAALHPSELHPAQRAAPSLRAAVGTCLALTWLNPHVYLDTVVLLGGIASRLEPLARVAFGVGAASASFAFFFALGYGARLLSPLFARPAAWRWLDAGVGLTMWLLAIWLLGF